MVRSYSANKKNPVRRNEAKKIVNSTNTNKKRAMASQINNKGKCRKVLILIVRESSPSLGFHNEVSQFIGGTAPLMIGNFTHRSSIDSQTAHEFLN